MEEFILELVSNVPMVVLFVIIAITLFALAKSADVLVDEAVTLSIKWGVPKVLIAATIVSLGTTLPEAAVSVLAAVSGQPGLALGNAVGSIICDTGLILGIAVLIGPVPVNQKIAEKQNLIQIAAGFALVVAALPFTSLSSVFTEGGRVPQFIGFIFLALLVLYIWRSIHWSRSIEGDAAAGDNEMIMVDSSPTGLVFVKLVLAIAGVIVSSKILIPTVQETALRLHIPESIIAATLVAFGTSLPELVTAVTAVRKKHGEIALGNVIGADILNVLFVTGASAAVTTGGLKAPPSFFVFLFPAMLLILIVSRIGIRFSGDSIKKPVGFILLGIYVATILLSYFLPGTEEYF